MQDNVTVTLTLIFKLLLLFYF